MFFFRLFVNPLYCGMLLDQSFMLNRRRTDDEYKTTIESVSLTRDELTMK